MNKTVSLSELKLVQTKKVEDPPFIFLQQFYEFEFSPITLSDTDENGLYDYKKLQASWHHNYNAYLFYLNKLPIGLAVINLASQIDNDQDTRDVAEFFVMPNYRHHGIGEIMAIEIFNRYPGKWEVRQLYQAKKARQFWLKIVDGYTAGKFTELEYNDHVWHGYLQKFTLKRGS